jgi:rhodanese-related sulfurtransferase
MTMSEPKEISVADAAKKLMAEDVQLIDVRRQDEWDAGRLDNATHIELELLTSKASEIDNDKPIIFYCHVGNRSRMATEAFAASGYEAYNLTGGIKAWKEAGQPLN